MAEPSAELTEEDRLVRWGWALGLVLPVIGIGVAVVLASRHDKRWTWIAAWALLGTLIYALIIVS